MTEIKFKRGYINGEQTIEIYEGSIDLVLYNDNLKKPSFYFYRFDPLQVLGESLSKEITLTSKKDVEKFLETKGIKDYNRFIVELHTMACASNMEGRYEM